MKEKNLGIILIFLGFFLFSFSIIAIIKAYFSYSFNFPNSITEFFDTFFGEPFNFLIEVSFSVIIGVCGIIFLIFGLILYRITYFKK